MARAWGKLAWADAQSLSAAALTRNRHTDTVNIVPRTAPRRVEEPSRACAWTPRWCLFRFMSPTRLGGPVTDLSRRDRSFWKMALARPSSSFCNEDARFHRPAVRFEQERRHGAKWKKPRRPPPPSQTANPRVNFSWCSSTTASHGGSFTRMRAAMFRRLSHTKPYGRTSLVGGCRIPCARANQERAILAQSPGNPVRRRRQLEPPLRPRAQEALLESDVLVYAMGIFEPAGAKPLSAEERNGPALLNELTEQSGGRHFPVSAVDQLPAIQPDHQPRASQRVRAGLLQHQPGPRRKVPQPQREGGCPWRTAVADFLPPRVLRPGRIELRAGRARSGPFRRSVCARLLER